MVSGGANRSGMDGRRIAALGALLTGLGIGLGAFGAHGLEHALAPRALGWWNVAVQYHLWNAIGLVALGAVDRAGFGKPAALIGAGVLLFAGSLYLMALTGATWLGMVTPLGGAAMMAGWLWAAWILFRAR